MSDQNFEDIPPRRRELYFRIMNHEKNFHPITTRLHFLDSHFPPNKLDKALAWLINNNFIGQNFMEWFKLQCGNSDLEMHARLLVIVDNAPLVPIIARKNFKL